MSINFEAEHMQGYNNPSIEIINLTLDPEGNITNITYNDIVKILSRGVFPILSIPAGGPDYKVFLPLTTIESNEKRIVFSGAETYEGADSTKVAIYGLVFTQSNPPAFLQKNV